MMKKMGIALVLVVLVAGGVFAQQGGSGFKNWVSGQVGIIGGGAGYERTFSPSLGVGAEAYYTSFFGFVKTIAVEGFAKWYPLKGRVFYVKVGLGYGNLNMLESFSIGGGTGNIETKEFSGFLVDPAIGWKIDVGQPGGFFIEPKLGLPIVIGNSVMSNYLFGFGMGFAF